MKIMNFLLLWMSENHSIIPSEALNTNNISSVSSTNEVLLRDFVDDYINRLQGTIEAKTFNPWDDPLATVTFPQEMNTSLENNRCLLRYVISEIEKDIPIAISSKVSDNKYSSSYDDPLATVIIYKSFAEKLFLTNNIFQATDPSDKPADPCDD